MRTFPFDVNTMTILTYHHLGEDIGYDESMRFRAVLTNALVSAMARASDEGVDSPVYRYLAGLVLLSDRRSRQRLLRVQPRPAPRQDRQRHHNPRLTAR